MRYVAPLRPVRSVSFRARQLQTKCHLENGLQQKLPTEVTAVEEGLFLREQELSDCNSEECVAMKAAAKDLLAIKTHQLGCPDPAPYHAGASDRTWPIKDDASFFETILSIFKFVIPSAVLKSEC